MKCLEIRPSKLSGSVNIPPSKSMAHRALFCAFLSDGKSQIDNIELSEDIISTCRVIEALGGEIQVLDSSFLGRKKLLVHGKGSVSIKNYKINCGESGTTARFVIPVSRLCEESAAIDGSGKLVSRPFNAFFPVFEKCGIEYEIHNNKLPLTLNGRLRAGDYFLPGDISSQFISGLLLALPLLDESSTIQITTPVESAAYIDMTISMQNNFGVEVHFDKKENKLIIPGCQKYIAQKYSVEGDWSQAAFWIAAGIMSGPIYISGLNKESIQGDKVIENLVKSMGGNVSWKNDCLVAQRSTLRGICIDVSQCPDIAPILAVLGSICEGRMEIMNASRLRIKESDRIKAIVTELTNIGGKLIEQRDGIIIDGVSKLKGGHCKSWNDHRIVMSSAVATTMCDNNVIIEGVSAVNKSYPSFWEHFVSLGGEILE